MADLASKAKEEARRAKHEAEIRATREAWVAHCSRVATTVPEAREAVEVARKAFEEAGAALGTSTDRAVAINAHQEAEQAFRRAGHELAAAVRRWGPEKAPPAPGAV